MELQRFSHDWGLSGTRIGLGKQSNLVQMNFPHFSAIFPSSPIMISNKEDSSHWSLVSDFEISTWWPISKFTWGSATYLFLVPLSKLPIKPSITRSHRKLLFPSLPLPTDWELLNHRWYCTHGCVSRPQHKDNCKAESQDLLVNLMPKGLIIEEIIRTWWGRAWNWCVITVLRQLYRLCTAQLIKLYSHTWSYKQCSLVLIRL